MNGRLSCPSYRQLFYTITEENIDILYVEYEPTQTISALYHNRELYLTPAYIKESLGVIIYFYRLAIISAAKL
ncbi:hypothetical protein QF028_005334 [Neobacillus sp. B4I6]